MSNLKARLGRIERRVGERPCAGCEAHRPIRVVSHPAQLDPAWFGCPRCGRRHPVKIIILEGGAGDLAEDGAS